MLGEKYIKLEELEFEGLAFQYVILMSYKNTFSLHSFTQFDFKF